MDDLYKDINLNQNFSVSVDETNNFLSTFLKSYHSEVAAANLSNGDQSFFSLLNGEAHLYIILTYNHYWPLVQNDVETFFLCCHSNENQITLLDLIEHTKKLNNIDIQNQSDCEKSIEFLNEHHLLPFDTKTIIDASITLFSTPESLAQEMFLKERKRAIKGISKAPIKSLNADVSYIHASIQKYDYMLETIDNVQFSAEFKECLWAYTKMKWYVCASGLGGVLEHLMYLTLQNYGEKALGKLHSKTPTASNYTRAFKEYSEIGMDQRQERYINGLFEIRNSISHFNDGLTAKEQCDSLITGISDVFRNYYESSKAYQKAH